MPPPQGEFARWGVVWMYSIHQTISLQPALAPAAAALLDEEELQLYSSHAKPRFAVYCKVRRAAPPCGGGGKQTDKGGTQTGFQGTARAPQWGTWMGFASCRAQPKEPRWAQCWGARWGQQKASEWALALG